MDLSYLQNAYDGSLVIVGDRSQLSVSGWDGSSSTILPCDGGAYQISPHSDRFSASEARASLSASESWDQISGELLYLDWRLLKYLLTYINFDSLRGCVSDRSRR